MTGDICTGKKKRNIYFKNINNKKSQNTDIMLRFNVFHLSSQPIFLRVWQCVLDVTVH